MFSSRLLFGLFNLPPLEPSDKQDEVQDGLDGGELSTQMRGKVQLLFPLPSLRTPTSLICVCLGNQSSSASVL